MKTLLTNTFIKSLTFEGKAEYYWDEKVTGLYLRLSKTRKTFYYRYRLEGKTNQYKIGRFNLISLKDARTKAAELYIKVQNGADPKGKKIQQKVEKEETGILFSEAFEAYKENKLCKLAARTQKSYLSIIENHIMPTFENKEVNSISRGDVTKFLEDKYKDIDGSQMIVSIKGILSGIFTYYMSREFVDRNPVRDASYNYKKEFKPRQRHYTDEEVKTLLQLAPEFKYPVNYIVTFALYTGKRVGEILNMQWDHIDFDKQVWTIPEHLTKNRTEDKVYLCDTMIQLLNERSEVREYCDYVLHSVRSKKSKIVRPNSDWYTYVREEAEIEGFILHDVRRTVSSNLAKLKVSHNIIDLVLNNGSSKHKKIRQTYNRYDYMEEKKEALDKWESKFEELMKVKEK